MVITFHGLEFVKISFGDMVLAFNPVSKASKYKSISFGADIAISSLNDEDFNGVEAVTRGDKEPFVISGPGEYEYKGIFVQGFPSESNYKGQKKINTFYNVVLEETNICFMGAVDSDNLKEYLKAMENEVDILFVPIGGDGVLEAADAYKLAVSLEPKVIIPIHHGLDNDKNSLKTFLREAGGENLKPVDKLTLRKKDVIGRQSEVVILSQS